MDRRTFLASCATAAGSLALLNDSPAYAAAKKGAFANAPLKMSAPPGWCGGETLEERLEQIAAWGLPGYEWLWPEGDLDALRAMADKYGLTMSCIVGAGSIAPRQMVDPTDHDRVVAQFKDAVKVAHKLGCKALIGLSGNERDDVSREKQAEYVVQCLKRLAPIAEDEDVVIVMEALNVLVNHPGYFLVTTEHTMEILEAVDSPNVKMCFDIYHQQISEGNVIRNIRNNIDRIGHFHVGDNPGRNQPGTGELNYKNIFKAIHETGYSGFVALECGNTTSVENALTYLREECLTWS